jgi:hypothetical protein
MLTLFFVSAFIIVGASVAATALLIAAVAARALSIRCDPARVIAASWVEPGYT